MNEPHYELTEEEMVHYANYALIDVCELCGDWVGIHNHHDESNFLTWIQNKLYCARCLK